MFLWSHLVFAMRCTEDFDASRCGAISRIEKWDPGSSSCEQISSSTSFSFSSVATVTGRPLPGRLAPDPVSLILFTRFTIAGFEQLKDGWFCHILYAVHPFSSRSFFTTAIWSLVRTIFGKTDGAFSTSNNFNSNDDNNNKTEHPAVFITFSFRFDVKYALQKTMQCVTWRQRRKRDGERSKGETCCESIANHQLKNWRQISKFLRGLKTTIPY